MNPRHKSKHWRGLANHQRGVGMIEVLVTLFILSVGLLGVASLQFIGSLTNSEALSRSQSVMVAQQFSERLRANAAMSGVGDGLVVNNAYFNQNLYNFNNLNCPGGGLPFQCFCTALPADVPDCQSGTCSAAQFAAYDAYEASCAAVATNPLTQLELTCDDNNAVDADACSTGSRHIIRLTWPVENWQDIERTLNADCNVGRATPHDCVMIEVTL